jgi:hypothetical protein
MHARTLALALLLLLGSFSNTLSTIPSTILEDENAIQFAGDTVDCGTNASNISFEIENSLEEYNFGDTYSGALVAYCGLWDATYKFDWSITDDDTGYWLIAPIELTFETNTTSVSYDPSYTDHFNEQPIHRYYLFDGNFTVNGSLYADNGNGGWDLISSTNDSFYVSTNLSTTACGYNTSLVNLRLTTPNSWNESNSSWEYVEDTNPILPVGSNGWGLWIYVDCPMWSAENRISWSLTNTNTSSTVSQYSHNTSLTTMGSPCNGYCYQVANGSMWYYERMFSQIDLLEGNYIFSVEVSNYNESSSSWEISTETNSTFEVWNSSTAPSVPDPYDGTLEINTEYDFYDSVLETPTASFEIENLVVGEMYFLDWSLQDSNGTSVMSGNTTWTATTNTSTEWVNASGLDAGMHCFTGSLYHVYDGYNVSFIYWDEHCILIIEGTLDADGDGVLTEFDLCPGTAAGASVNADGCSISQLDADGDGVSDLLDACPNTPVGETVDIYGCSDSQLDDDSDGVMNNADLCSNTAAGETVDVNGCSDSQLDDDSDGVMNNADLCPNTPAGETVDAEGCAPSQYDADGDGVPDLTDQCPSTPSGVAVGADGCNYPPVCDISYEDGVGNVVSLQSQLIMGTGTSSSSLSLPTGTYEFLLECTDPESDMLSMTVTLDGGSPMTFTGSPLSTGAIPVPVQDGMTLSKTITYDWTDGVNSGIFEIDVSLIGDDTADPSSGLPGFELWITLLAIIASLFFNRTRKII